MSEDLSQVVKSVWVHPSGARITVFNDGSYIAINAQGKRKRTSATPEKLEAGHGLWKQIDYP